MGESIADVHLSLVTCHWVILPDSHRLITNKFSSCNSSVFRVDVSSCYMRPVSIRPDPLFPKGSLTGKEVCHKPMCLEL